MPALQSLVLTDRASTPVNYTLLPIDRKDGVGYVGVADATGSPLSLLNASISVRESGGKSRGLYKTHRPIVTTETVGTASVVRVLRNMYAETKYTFDAECTEAEINDFVGMHQSGMGTTKPLFHEAIVKRQRVY